MLMSPLQDWDGNTTEIDADRVLALCALLVVALIGNLISSFFLFPLRNKDSMAGVMLKLQTILMLVMLILLGLKWFPRYAG